eukprot:scaffold12969_cov65-Attheya_sp.AAC.8
MECPQQNPHQAEHNEDPILQLIIHGNRKSTHHPGHLRSHTSNHRLHPCNVRDPPTDTRTAHTLTHATYRHCMPPPAHNNLPERWRYHRDAMSRRSTWTGHGEHALHMEPCQG